MKYTIIYTDSEGNWKTKTCVASHDKNVAWGEASTCLEVGETLRLLSPGEQIIYSESDIEY